MKPRPTISMFTIVLRPHTTRTTLQCCRSVHIRAIAPAISCHLWHDKSRNTIRSLESVKSWKAQSRRHASTAAAPAPKSQYGRVPLPPPAKLSRTNVPAKPTYSSKPTPPAKLSATPNTRAAITPAKTAPSTQVPIVKARENLNPPPFTYAPDLTVPERNPDQSFISYLWKTGRAYLAFYKSGVSNVRQTSKLARSLREKAAEKLGKDAATKDISDVLTRAEWQVVKRSRKDMLRLPAFGLIFLVFGEWTPLLVMYLTPIIPEACRIPSQVKKELSKVENKRGDRQRRAGVDAMRLMMKDRRVAGALPANANSANAQVVPDSDAIRHMNPLEMTLLELVLQSARYGCHSRIWDWIRVTPPKFLLQRNVRKTMEYLCRDDELIKRDGGHQALEKREVERACVERGLDVLGKREDDLRKSLMMWYKGGRG